MKLPSLHLISIILALTFFVSKGHTQNSIIDKSLSLRPAVVTIQAVNLSNKSVRQGAGIFIHHTGTLITNVHTIKGADHIYAILSNTNKINLTVTKLYPSEDLALLHPKTPFKSPAVILANSNTLKLRQTIFHIGHSYILDGTISQGKITGLGTSQSAKQKGIHDVAIIQVNLDVYKGDSGGPLLDQHGRLIGLMVAKDIKKNKTSYAIPSNKIKKLLSKIQE